jgi:hypothetical protein
VTQSYSRALGPLFVASYDSLGYGGGILRASTRESWNEYYFPYINTNVCHLIGRLMRFHGYVRILCWNTFHGRTCLCLNYPHWHIHSAACCRCLCDILNRRQGKLALPWCRAFPEIRNWFKTILHMYFITLCVSTTSAAKIRIRYARIIDLLEGIVFNLRWALAEWQRKKEWFVTGNTVTSSVITYCRDISRLLNLSISYFLGL